MDSKITGAVTFAEELKKYLQMLADAHPDMVINLKYDMINTGIAEKQNTPFGKWREWEDLGGRRLTATIDIPNYKKSGQ